MQHMANILLCIRPSQPLYPPGLVLGAKRTKDGGPAFCGLNFRCALPMISSKAPHGNRFHVFSGHVQDQLRRHNPAKYNLGMQLVKHVSKTPPLELLPTEPLELVHLFKSSWLRHVRETKRKVRLLFVEQEFVLERVKKNIRYISKSNLVKCTESSCHKLQFSASCCDYSTRTGLVFAEEVIL